MPATVERRRPRPRVAAIDLGSNSAHLVIAESDGSGGFRVLDSEKLVLRMAEAIDHRGYFTQAGIQQAVAAFRQMSEIAHSYTPHIKAVATFATREAKNHEVLLEKIKRQTGIDVEVIEGIEEARLEFLGVQQGLPIFGRTCLVVDIGGGSTEVMVADGSTSEFKFVTSLNMGAVTFTKQFLGAGKVTKATINKMEAEIARGLHVLPRAKQIHFDWAIASSGTAKAIATICAKFFQQDEISDPNGYEFTVDHLRALYQEFVRLKDSRKIRTQFGVDTKRAEILLAGAAVLLQISERLGVKRWLTSTYSLREGMVVDAFRRSGIEIGTDSKNIRWKNIRAFALQMGTDLVFAETTSHLAQQVHEGLLKASGTGDALSNEAELLGHAAVLCEVGKEISVARYHKHSSYMITNSSVAGFTQYEKHMIGMIVRYHRRSFAGPQVDHEYASFARYIPRVNFLAACLRIAVALNRSRKGYIRSVVCRKKKSKNSFEMVLSPRLSSSKIEAELYHAQAAFQQIEKALGIKIEI